MKTLPKNVLQKWGVLALVITAISSSTLARAAELVSKPPAEEESVEEDIGEEAEISQKEGVSLSELKRITRNKLEVLVDGQTLSFKGSIPYRCVKNGQASAQSEFENGKHLVTIRLAPECENNFQPKLVNKKPEKRVALSKILPALHLADETGAVHIKFLKGDLDPDSEDRVDAKTPLVGKDGKPISILSSADKAAADRKAEELAAAKAKKEKIEEVLSRAEAYCNDRDFEGARTALDDAKDLFGDVSRAIGGLLDLEKESFLLAMKSAKSADSAKEAREKYIEVALEKGWDETSLDQAYIEKRFDLITRKIEDVKSEKELTTGSIDRALQDWKSELKDMDRDLFKKSQNRFAFQYGELANLEFKAGNFAAADRLYARGSEFAQGDSKIDWQKARIKTANRAFDSCARKVIDIADPRKAEAALKKCNELAKNGQEQADSIKSALKARGEDGKEAYDAFMAEHGALYGEGPVMYTPQGKIHPYAPGLIKQTEMEVIRGWQENYYQRMMQQQMGGGGQQGARGSSLY